MNIYFDTSDFLGINEITWLFSYILLFAFCNIVLSALMLANSYMLFFVEKVFFVCVQVDFNLPERFDITYVDSDSVKKRPIMIHRAVLGSLERFFGVLIEHYAGDFPLWLSPIQARILPVTDMQVISSTSP